MTTVHCVTYDQYKAFINNQEFSLVALCGQSLATRDWISPQTAFALPTDFKTERSFRRSYIRCGKCLTHEDLPLLILAEIDDD